MTPDSEKIRVQQWHLGGGKVAWRATHCPADGEWALCHVTPSWNWQHNDYRIHDDLADLKVDEPVMVRDFDQDDWRPAYYAEKCESVFRCWEGGTTKWSSGGCTLVWRQLRRPTKEELES